MHHQLKVQFQIYVIVLNVWYVNVSIVSSTTGYRQVLSSGNGTLMNIATIYSSFNLNLFIICSTYQNSLNLSIQGIQFNNYIIINTHPKTKLTFNWINLITINFQSYYYDTNSKYIKSL